MFEGVLAEIKSAGETYLGFSPLTRKLENSRLYANFILVLPLHVALIWLLASQLAPPSGIEGTAKDTQVALIAPSPASPPKWDPIPEPQLTAATSEVAPPEIEIQDTTSGGIGAISTADILPPRPDPAIRNVNHALPAAFATMANQPEVLLTVLVNMDGSIGDARVVKSCGVALLDQLAQSFAKANWRFRAATANGTAVSDWTTVMVKFMPPG